MIGSQPNTKRQFGQLKQDSTIDGQKTSKSTYGFDKIYSKEASNQEVYADSCQQIIERVTQGYNGKFLEGGLKIFRYYFRLWSNHCRKNTHYDRWKE